MSVLKDARQKAGCDTEEFWFYQRDRELIEKMKSKNLRVIQGGQSGTSPKREESRAAPPGAEYDRKKAA
jgi:hypothetical protein